MTDTTNVTPTDGEPQKPTITLVNAGELVAEFKTRFPYLQSVGDQLDLVAGLYATYVRNPLGETNAKEAIADLDVLFNTDLAGVREAVAALTNAEAQLAADFAEAFERRTGRKFNVKTLKFEDVVKEERAEQKDQERLARELLVNGRTLVTDLVITDRYTVKRSAPAKKAERGSVLVGFINRTAERLLPGQEKVVVEVKPQADWLTPPILDADDSDGTVNEEYVELDRFLRKVVAVSNRFVGQPNRRDLVFQFLGNARPPITQDDVELKVERASELAEETLAQTNAILALVGRDTQKFTDLLDGIVDFREMYSSVAALFFPQK